MRSNRSIVSRIALGAALVPLLMSCAAPSATVKLANASTTEIASDVDYECPSPRRDASDRYRHMAVPSAAYAMPPPPPPPAPPPPPGLVAPSPVMVAPKMAAQEMTVPGTIASVSPPISDQPQDTARYPEASINPIKRTAEAPVSTFAMEVDTASYSTVRRFLNNGSRPPTDAVRVEELMNYFDYNYPLATDRDAPFKPNVVVAPSPWSEGKRLIHIGIRGYDIPRDKRPPLNLTLLMDVSGSMQDDDRLPLAIRAMRLLAAKLTAADHVSLVVYAGASGVVLPPTAGNKKRDIICALEDLQAGGSTAGGQGLALAYKMAEKHRDPKAVNRVILMTDGDFNVGITDPERLKDFVAEKRKTGIYLSVFGFGGDNYNDELMQSLAQNGNGTASYIDTFAEARKVFDDEVGGTLFPIADDVKLQIEFNPAKVAEWRLIGYETRALAREDFNNDRVDAGEVGAGAEVTALYEISAPGQPGSVDPLRYQSATPASAPSRGGDLGFLKIRYKTPGSATSKLIERPITEADAVPTLSRAPESTRWAAAIAAYGQLLRQDPWIGAGFGWPQMMALAESAKGTDPHGRRTEFIGLAAKAQALSVGPKPPATGR
jgi:Ca-activated chloride channel homolog